MQTGMVLHNQEVSELIKKLAVSLPILLSSIYVGCLVIMLLGYLAFLGLMII